MKISCLLFSLCVAVVLCSSYSKAKPLDNNNKEDLLFVPDDSIGNELSEPNENEKRLYRPNLFYKYNMKNTPSWWRNLVKSGKRELSQTEKKRWLGFLTSLAAPHVINHAKKLLGRELNEEEKRGWFKTIGKALIPHITGHLFGKRELESPEEQKRAWGFLASIVAPHVINHAKKLLGRELNEEEKRGWFKTIGKALIPHITGHLFGKREFEKEDDSSLVEPLEDLATNEEEQKRSWFKAIGKHVLPHAIGYVKDKWFGGR